MRLLYLSHYYPPEVNAPANRVSEICREWAAMGHEVHVVTCCPSHPQGVLYPGWRMGWHRREVRDGVHVHRVWTLLGPNRGVVRRTLNYLSFVPFAAWRAVRLGRFDALVATSPQFFCAVAGWLSGLLRRTPWVFEVRDLWPESAVAVGAVRRSLPVRLAETVERAMYRHATLVACVTPAFVENLAARGVPRSKLALVPNGVDLEFWAGPADGPGWRARRGIPRDALVASYVGTVGMAHGLGTVLEAARLLKAARPEVLLLVVGDGAEREGLEERARREGLDNVRFVGQVAREEVRDVMAASDVSLVLLRDQELFRTVLPTKLLESMAAARPVILGVRGQALAVLEAAGAGAGIPPEDAEALARAVGEMADSPQRRAALGAAGRAFVAREYDRRAWARRYEQLLRERVARAL